MWEDAFAAAGIDYQSGCKRFMGNDELYRRMLQKFLQDESLEDAGLALEREDWASFSASIHTLKGVSGNLSLQRVFALTSEMMTLCRSGTYDALPDRYAALREAYSQTAAAIRMQEG